MAAPINVRIDERNALKAEARKILDVKAADRTDDQAARLKAIETEVASLQADIDLLAKMSADDIGASTTPRIEGGEDRATLKPWGPTLHGDATDDMRAEARQAALGEFAVAVKRQASGEGTDPRLFAAATGMGTAVPSDGGFAVPREVASGIERDMFTQGEILSRVDARTVSGDAIAYVVNAETSRASTRSGGVLGYWVDEGTAATASAPKLARVELKLRKVGTLGYMTDELVADAAALGGELEKMFTEELVFQVEDAIFEGNGTAKPLGFTNANCIVSVAKETGQAAATIVNENLIKMWARLRPGDKKNAVWLTNGDCGPQLDVLSQAIGTGGIPSRIVNYDSSGAISIKGRPVIETEFNSTLGTQHDIVLVNLSNYRLIRKGGVQQASSIHVRFTQGEQTFRAFYRCDGQQMLRSAITPFKGSNALTSVVTLDTRS